MNFEEKILYIQDKEKFKCKHRKLLSDLSQVIARVSFQQNAQNVYNKRIALMLRILNSDVMPKDRSMCFERFERILYSIDKTKLSQFLSQPDSLEPYCNMLVNVVEKSIQNPLFNQKMHQMIGTQFDFNESPNCFQSQSQFTQSGTSCKTLERELANLDPRFVIDNVLDQHLTLPIKLAVQIDDSELPSFPPAIVIVPFNYPQVCPQLILDEQCWNSTELFTSVYKTTQRNLLKKGYFTFGSILDCWLYSIQQTITETITTRK